MNNQQFYVRHFFATTDAELFNGQDDLQEMANRNKVEIDLYESADAAGNVALANGGHIGRSAGAVKHIKTYYPNAVA